MRTVLRRSFFVLTLAFAAASGGAVALAQGSVTITEPAGALLPQKFGDWTMSAGQAVGGGSPMSLVNANKVALEECQPQRSQLADYTSGGRTLHVEAVQFGDWTGAFSAFTLERRRDMSSVKELGSSAAAGGDAVLFTVGDSIVVAYPATGADAAMLKPLAAVMPKVFGNKGVAPQAPTLLPAAGMVEGSVRYALGPASYSAEGGVLPAAALGWDKSAEAASAEYRDKRGSEVVTILLYPTPAIAGTYTRAIEGVVSAAGATLGNARVRREGAMVLLATGTFDGDLGQKMIENIHLRQQVSFDQDIQPTEHQKIVQTYSLLTNIAILAGVLMAAAVLLGLFLGGGRAAYRVMRGKPAASEAEFLSLHLDAQNKAIRFDP